MDILELEEKIKVYIKIDETGNIIAVNSSIFIDDTTDWIKIDEGNGDKYAHAQSNYFDDLILNEHGIYNYKYLNNEIHKKTEEEINEEISLLPPPPPSEIEVLKSKLNTVIERNEFLEDCIAEMAAQIY